MIPISVAIMTYKDKVLMMHRDNKTTRNPNKWGLIGGHVEKGESFEQALVREVKEESNVDIKEYELIFEVTLNLDGDNLEFHYFHVPLNKTQALNVKLMDEGQSVEFKTFAELKKLNLTNSLEYILRDPGNAKKLIKLISGK